MKYEATRLTLDERAIEGYSGVVRRWKSYETGGSNRAHPDDDRTHRIRVGRTILLPGNR